MNQNNSNENNKNKHVQTKKRHFRNRNGYGSVTKLKGNRRNPFMVRIFERFKENGSPVHKVIGYYKTRTEANEALALYNADPHAHEVSQLTFDDVWKLFIKQRYDDNDKKVPNSYVAAYAWLSDIHKMKFCDVKLFHLQAAVNACTRNFSTKKNIKIVANLIFKYAIGNDITSKNYAELIELPPEMKSDMHKPYTEEELQILWQYSDDPRVQTVLILVYTGMRPLSFFTMKTANVYLDKQYMVGGVKTAGAKSRDIPIANCILPIVKALYNPDNEYLFMRNGRPLNHTTYTDNYFSPAMELTGLKHLPHDGRATCETILDRLKVQRSVIDAILGHVQKSVGEKYYREVSVKDRLDAVNQIPAWPKK